MTIQEVGVIGCGAMGAGIAQVMLQGGCEVTVCEAEQAFLDKGLQRLHSTFNMLAEKEKISPAQRDDAIQRLSGTTSLKTMKDFDLIIEAVFENLQVKLDVFKNLDSACGRNTIFASNTSSLFCFLRISILLFIVT